MNYAFYGQAISTTGRRAARPIHAQQRADATTRVRRLDGQIVADYFDVYPDGLQPLEHRREARKLLAAIADTERGFDAIIIGDTDTALTTIIQYDDLIGPCTQYGVQLWLPEIDEPVDRDNAEHQEIIKTKLWGSSPRLWNRVLPIAAEEEAAFRSTQPDRRISSPLPMPARRTPDDDSSQSRDSGSPVTSTEERPWPADGREPWPTASRDTIRAPQPPARGSVMRFAFCNRLAAEDQEDPDQVSRYRALIESVICQVRRLGHPYVLR